MTIPWVVDDGPFGLLAQKLNSVWAWPAGVFHTVGEVARRAADDKSKRRGGLLALMDGGARCVVVHELMMGSQAEGMLYSHIRPDGSRASEHLAEHQAIALCATEFTAGVFVAFDKGATFLALSELGPARVASPFDFWHDLHVNGCITEPERDELMRVTATRSALPIPRRFRKSIK